MAETYSCDNCQTSVDRGDAIRRETMADLDADAWQTLCCPHCGARLETVFVGDEP